MLRKVENLTYTFLVQLLLDDLLTFLYVLSLFVNEHDITGYIVLMSCHFYRYDHINVDLTD